jgi:2'-5' RNA ligase
MQAPTNLYLIALIPHPNLREQIKDLKEEMKERFNAARALKSPAHITLQMPFKRSKKNEPYLINTLKEFAKQQNIFNLELSGFGCFSPHVIFVKVTNQQPIINIHAKLKKVLIDKLKFKENEIIPKIHPHITIAMRDLSEQEFNKAWPEFEKREFKVSFIVNSLFLLQHNGKYWDIYREFLF